MFLRLLFSAALLLTAGCQTGVVDHHNGPCPKSTFVDSYQPHGTVSHEAIGPFQGKVFDETNSEELVGDGEKVFDKATGKFWYLSRKVPPPEEQKQRYQQFRDTMKTIPRTEWPQRIKDQAAVKARVSDWCLFPAYNQASTNYCWANGPCQSFTIARLIQGNPLRIISAASIGGPITGFRNVGGWELDAAEYLLKYGATTIDRWPNAAISRSYNTDTVTADRPNYMGLEIVECHSFDEFATCMLQGYVGAVAYNWWSHVVTACDLVLISENPPRFGIRDRNSWDDSWGDKNEAGYGGFVVFSEGKGTPSSGFMWRQVVSSAPPKARSFSNVAYELSEADESRRILIFTTDGCAPCRQQKVEAQKLIDVGWDVEFIHDSKQPEACKYYDVTKFPVTICLAGKKTVSRLNGYHSAIEIAKEALKEAPSDKHTGLLFRRRRGGCSGGGCSKCFSAVDTEYAIAA